MGNLVAVAEVYRDEPLKDLTGEFGGTQLFNYGACRVTGWRKQQEDKVVCKPDFYNNYSFFGVYDGHGGKEAAEYLRLYLHKHVKDALKETGDDVELALFLAFLRCDLTLREITEEELLEIRKPSKKCKVTYSVSTETNMSSDGFSTSRPKLKAKFLATRDVLAGPSCSSNGNNIASSSIGVNDGTYSVPGTSSSVEENYDRSEVLPKVTRAVKSLIAESETVRTLYSSGDLQDEDEEDDKDWDEEMEEASESDMSEEKSSEDEESSSENDESGSESDSSIIDNAEKINAFPLIGVSCGSTATVVLVKSDKVYVANVGDSRCIASINGQATALSIDHSPEDSSERDRIRKAGSRVTKDGRINSGLNMSRSFGDYGLKMKKTSEACQAVSCVPDIKVIDVTDEMEFIVIASDGIWNALENQDVVDFIKQRKGSLELPDICAELFEALIPLDLTDDGTGCDNMTMIIIEFSNILSAISYHTSQRVVYVYPQNCNTVQKKKENRATQTDQSILDAEFSDAKQAADYLEDSILRMSSGMGGILGKAGQMQSQMKQVFDRFFSLAEQKKEEEQLLASSTGRMKTRSQTKAGAAQKNRQ